MDGTRPILYGVADYAQIRRKNAWFVDRTAKIRDLESIAYAVFLRPRRFGKSLFLHLDPRGVLRRALSEPLVDSFQARELTKKENFTSLLYWLGITTITGNDFELMRFGVPNETLKQLAAKMIPDAYSDIYKIDGRIFDINKELVAFARRGEWRGFAGILAEIVKENFAHAGTARRHQGEGRRTARPVFGGPGARQSLAAEFQSLRNIRIDPGYPASARHGLSWRCVRNERRSVTMTGPTCVLPVFFATEISQNCLEVPQFFGHRNRHAPANKG